MTTDLTIRTINNFKKFRTLTLKTVENLSLEQILKVPEGFSNNICWNLGHLIVAQQILHYEFSSLEKRINEDNFSGYKKGTSPKDWLSSPGIDEVELIKKLLIEHPDQLLADYLEGKFQSYQSYETSSKVILESIEDAILFVNYHEGIHYGTILALKKIV